MKTLAFLCLSLAVALGIPVLHPGEEKTFLEGKQSPLVGDQLPMQGHVVVEDPAPQAVPSSEEHQEKVSPVKMKQGEETAELEVEVKPEVKEEEIKAEVKLEPEVKVEEKEVQVDEEAEPQQEAEAKMEQQPEMVSELQAEPDFKVVAEAEEEVSMKKEEEEAEPEMKVGEEFVAEEEAEPQPEEPVEADEVMQPELQDEDFKVESEIKVEPDVQMELEPEEEYLLTEAQEKPDVQMSLESEMFPGQVIEERHIDMEGKYEAMGEPHVEKEPLDDNSLLGDEAGQDAAFQRQSPEAEALTQEEEELMMERNDDLNEETIMEMEPELVEEPLQNEDAVPYAADLEDEAALDMAGQQMPLSENYFPEEEAGMEMKYEKQEDSVEEDEYLKMLEEARREATEEEKDNEEWRRCPGLLLEEKCYRFFKTPMRAADAEFVCQGLYPKGHLASITNYSIHRGLMDLILKESGNYTRTWVGGIRYLNTNRFVWLDGSHWSYSDWLLGEPNNTSGVEDCLEVLALGKGKFNDFTCWEPQPFICSYTYP